MKLELHSIVNQTLLMLPLCFLFPLLTILPGGIGYYVNPKWTLCGHLAPEKKRLLSPWFRLFSKQNCGNNFPLEINWLLGGLLSFVNILSWICCVATCPYSGCYAFCWATLCDVWKTFGFVFNCCTFVVAFWLCPSFGYFAFHLGCHALPPVATDLVAMGAGSPSRSFSLNSNHSAGGGRFVFPGLEWDDEFHGVYTGQCITQCAPAATPRKNCSIQAPFLCKLALFLPEKKQFYFSRKFCWIRAHFFEFSKEQVEQEKPVSFWLPFPCGQEERITRRVKGILKFWDMRN